jgi:hypothetical protein
MNSIKLLRERTKQNRDFEVVHSDHVWQASFQWTEPATNEKIQEIYKIFGNRIPNDYIKFLSEVSNGATLFYDNEYGQWGYKLFGTEDLAEKQKLWQSSIPIDWESRFVAFCELYGEAHVMSFDLSRFSKNNHSFAVVEATALDSIEDWTLASRSFQEWIDHLITAQGDKYWLWK